MVDSEKPGHELSVKTQGPFFVEDGHSLGCGSRGALFGRRGDGKNPEPRARTKKEVYPQNHLD